MKKFKKSDIKMEHIEAAQYGIDEAANNFVVLCAQDYSGKTYEVPKDLLGKPKNAFKAVNTGQDWQEIKSGDWIVKNGDKVFVVDNGVFTLFFEEVN